jgi:hypothetical protein
VQRQKHQHPQQRRDQQYDLFHGWAVQAAVWMASLV